MTDPNTSRGGSMTVAVTGATGFVGRHLVRTLLDAGHRVRALVRDPGKAARVLPQHDGLTLIEGSLPGPDGIAEAVDGADACAHLVGIIREAAGGQTFRRLHVDATRSVVEACEAAGVGRYLHMSALGASPEGPAPYQKTKAEAERIVMLSSLRWTIFRPSLVMGPDGDAFKQFKGWAEGRSAPFFFLPYFTRIQARPPTTLAGLSQAEPPKIIAPSVMPVSVSDVADAFTRSLTTDDAIGEIYPLTGPDTMTWPQMLRAIRDALPQAKKDHLAIGVPEPVAVVQAILAKVIGLGGLLPFDAGMAQMGARDSVADTTKARTHLGFEPAGFQAQLAASVR